MTEIRNKLNEVSIHGHTKKGDSKHDRIPFRHQLIIFDQQQIIKLIALNSTTKLFATTIIYTSIVQLDDS